ncbi:uncharacterized protein LOC125246859 [Megalobrama amblycephala]|uniref:uncharacterized protein LOC125246859 n=1 Tax=Megalobrama amblycephala TaxID=75352 RepID=UPI002014137B|nr:uncharacterized protein LOC125246859 [Megalobrama amblycephala]
MKLTKTKPNWLLTLILTFHIISAQIEASHGDDDVRILIVGIRGDSRFSAADILSGRTDGGQEDREIVKTPVITDEGRRMMLVTGPNLCEEDTARQSFTTALFLSSPGPHVVLMVLNLEDEESEQCDVVKRAQELLGAEVLQYCIVLLHQERFTGASRGIAGEMIDACGGRFHMIRDSEPDQTAALVAEIDKLVWLNGDGFYSVLRQELKTEEMSEDVHEEIQLLSVIYDALGGAAGIIAWIFLVSLTVLGVYIEGGNKILIFRAAFTLPTLFMIYLRHFLSPDVAVPLNLALMTSLAAVFTIEPILINKFNTSRDTSNSSKYIGAAAILSFPFLQGSALVLGTLISIRSWSDVLIACHTAPGVTVGAYAFIFQHEKISDESLVFVLGSFLFCAVGATLSMGFVTVFALLGMNMTIMLLISGLTMAYWHLKSETLHNVIGLSVLTLFFSCGCVLIGSVFLILGLMMSFLKVLIESLVSSYLFYVALLLIVMWRRQTASVQVTNRH